MKRCSWCPGSHSLSESPSAQAHLQQQFGLVESTASLAASHQEPRPQDSIYATADVRAGLACCSRKGTFTGAAGQHLPAPPGLGTSHLTSGKRWIITFG